MTLTDRDRKVMLVIIPIVLLVAYWFLLLSPQRKDAAAAGTQLTEAQQHRDDVQSQARKLESAKSTFARDYTTLVRLGKAIPTKVDVPSLIVQLDDAARGTGIRFDQIKTGQRAETPPPAAPANNSGSNSSGNSSASSSGSKPVDAGGQPAQSAPGSAVESANNASKTSDQANQAAQSTGVDATTSSSAKKGGLPIGGGAANGTAAPQSRAPGLDSVPLEFQFDGSFFDLADFFHRMKRFVRVTNKRMEVRGRLMTIDGLTFKAAEKGFPELTAQVKATVWLSPKDQGQTAGATPAGPGTTPASGSGGIAGDQAASTFSSTPTAVVTP